MEAPNHETDPAPRSRGPFGDRRRGVAPRLSLAAEATPETTSVRLPKTVSICVAPQDVVADLLRAEGFTDIRYVPLPPGTNTPDAIAQGKLDFGLNYAPLQVAGIDRGVAMKVLAGAHVGCFELFVKDAIHGVPDLGGKRVGIPAMGSPEHLFLSVIAANVGIDPKAQIEWVTSGSARPKQLFIDGKIDAFLGFPPEPQELHAMGVGRVVVNSALDRPWSQYFCCMLAGSKGYVENHPVATKRVLRAILKAADLCASDPARVARMLVDAGFTPRYDYARQSLQELPYDKWREYDAEDTMLFYALRLHELGMIESDPKRVIADGTDWRFLNEVKRELKA
jgi:NitT/TauT family transport system substrate-binding protein